MTALIISLAVLFTSGHTPVLPCLASVNCQLLIVTFQVNFLISSALVNHLFLPQAKALLTSGPLDLSHLFHPGTFLNALRQQSARTLKQVRPPPRTSSTRVHVVDPRARRRPARTSTLCVF